MNSTTTGSTNSDGESTKEILLSVLDGKEDVVTKIMSDVSDYIRLDDLEEIKSCTSTTPNAAVTLIFSKIQKYYNTNDEAFVMVALEKLQMDFFSGSSDDHQHRRQADSRLAPDQAMFECNGHILIVECMSCYPNNYKIQNIGCYLISHLCKGALLLGGFDGLRQFVQFLLFIVSEHPLMVIANPAKNYVATQKKEDDEEERAAATELSLTILYQLDRICHDQHGAERFHPVRESFYPNMESLELYHLAFDAIQKYPSNYPIVFWGLHILQRPVSMGFGRNVSVLERLIHEKTSNVFYEVICRAVADQFEIFVNKGVQVRQLAETLIRKLIASNIDTDN